MFIFSFQCFAQNEQTENYYVTANTLNVRSGPSIDSSSLFRLNKFDNILFFKDTTQSKWFKISYQGNEGYVFKKFIKKGKTKVTTYTYRIGAVCRDGTRSTATGRGACSHHGGVSYWLTDEKKSVTIIDD